MNIHAQHEVASSLDEEALQLPARNVGGTLAYNFRQDYRILQDLQDFIDFIILLILIIL